MDRGAGPQRPSGAGCPSGIGVRKHSFKVPAPGTHARTGPRDSHAGQRSAPGREQGSRKHRGERSPGGRVRTTMGGFGVRTLPSTGTPPELHAGPQLSTRRCDFFTILVGQRSHEKHRELDPERQPAWETVGGCCTDVQTRTSVHCRPAPGHLRSQPSTASHTCQRGVREPALTRGVCPLQEGSG